MQVTEFVQIYNAIRGKRYAVDFIGAEITTDHDQVFIHLDTPMLFSDEELKFLENLGLHSHSDSDQLINTFVIYI